MSATLNFPRLHFGQEPLKSKWVTPTQEELADTVAREMRREYGQDTFARFRDIMQTERDEHRNGEQRDGNKPMRHEKIAMQKGLEDKNVALFNKFVIQAVVARNLLKGTAMPDKVRSTAQQYADLITQLPGGAQILGAQMNAALGTFRKGLEKAMQQSGFQLQ